MCIQKQVATGDVIIHSVDNTCSKTQAKFSHYKQKYFFQRKHGNA